MKVHHDASDITRWKRLATLAREVVTAVESYGYLPISSPILDQLKEALGEGVDTPAKIEKE